MTNIVLIARDRPRLTIQTLHSIRRHTLRDQFTLTVVDDGSIEPLNIASANEVTVRLSKPSSRVGFVKNLGAWFSERYWGRGEFLCFLDNDVYCKPGWLERLTNSLRIYSEFAIIGGYRHPYHGLTIGAGKDPATYRNMDETDAVAGYCHFMRWETWDLFGPYHGHAQGVCQSEDYAICRKAVENGFRVGYVHPPVIAVCGVTNTEGKPAVGSEAIPREEGLLYL